MYILYHELDKNMMDLIDCNSIVHCTSRDQTDTSCSVRSDVMSHGPLSYRRAVDACRSLDAGEPYNPNTTLRRIPIRSLNHARWIPTTLLKLVNPRISPWTKTVPTLMKSSSATPTIQGVAIWLTTQSFADTQIARTTILRPCHSTSSFSPCSIPSAK